MEAIKFKEANTAIAKNQDEYKTLWAFKDDSPQGYTITCWKLSFTERLRVLFSGKIWRNDLTFNKPFTPTYMTTKKGDVLETEA